MKTGIESLDTGAPDITYEGNEGPKSPQQEQQMQMQEMVGGENDRVRELLYKQETRGLDEDEKEELRELIKTISAGMQGGIGDMAMKPGLIDEYRNYKMGQGDAGEQFMSPRDYYRSQEQDRMGVAGGGIMKNVKGQDHMLAYITPGEANTLEDLGGQKTMTPEGIPAYPPPGEKGGPGSGSEGRSLGGGGGERRQANNERFEMAYNPPAQAPTPTFNIHTDTGREEEPYIMYKKQKVPQSVWGTGSDPREKEDFVENKTILQKAKDKATRFKHWSTAPINKLMSKRLTRERIEYLKQKYPTLWDDEEGLDLSSMPELNKLYLDNKLYTDESLQMLNKGGEFEQYKLMEKNNPTLFAKGDLGNFMSTPKPDWFTGSNADWETKKREIGQDRGLDTGGGDGQGGGYMGYPSYAAWLAAQGSVGTPAEVEVEEEDSVIPTDSVATGPISNQYHIPGASNFYSNLASTLPTGQTTGTTFDPTSEMLKYHYAADGGRIGYAGGGITDLRQGYFLGKLVKKVTKGIKKIAKSPLGKAALAFGAYKLGGSFLKDKGIMASLRNMWSGSPLGYKTAGDSVARSGGFLNSLKQNPFPWIAGASALGGLYTAATEKEDEGDGYDYAEKDKWLKYFSGVGDEKNWQSIRGLADGGRIGLKEGLTPRQAALSAMYGEDDDEDNMYKFAYGGSAGMPPVSIAPEGFNSQSFPDDESTGMAQATPQNPMPMPMAPQMDPRMMQMAQMDPRRMAQQSMPRRMAAEGGRIGYADGTDKGPLYVDPESVETRATPLTDFESDLRYEPQENRTKMYYKMLELLHGMSDEKKKEFLHGGRFDQYVPTKERALEFTNDPVSEEHYETGEHYANGGRTGAEEGGLMNLGGMEKDYRAEGGFVPLGGEERADDVPARLSKNEFVFTADAVRNAGSGDIDKGAEVMENLMDNLEQGGQVSQQSQGLEGAREMFQTQQRLGEVL